jgi:ComF family protein
LSLLDLIFPPRCGGCGRHGFAWCASCAATIEAIDETSLAGVPVIATGRLAGPLQAAIHRYKYAGRMQLAGPLAARLAAAIRRNNPGIRALTFVPLHPARRRERGFNQAERLAAELGRELSLPVVDGLERVRPTPAQVGLTQLERNLNLAGAFRWSAKVPPGRGLAVVDDVCTTGATLLASAQAVSLAGGTISAFLVVARAQSLPALAVT